MTADDHRAFITSLLGLTPPSIQNTAKLKSSLKTEWSVLCVDNPKHLLFQAGGWDRDCMTRMLNVGVCHRDVMIRRAWRATQLTRRLRESPCKGATPLRVVRTKELMHRKHVPPCLLSKKGLHPNLESTRFFRVKSLLSFQAFQLL